MQLAQYLQRIRFEGRATADLHTLCRLHRLHLEAIAYENLDVQLGCLVGFDLRAIFDKLVMSGSRGGWCFEMNSLFAWALEEIGFTVTQLACGVEREQLGDCAIGGHMALCVDLDQPYLVDVGFGDGLIEPIPIIAGPIRQEFLQFRLDDLGAGWWRFHNHPRAGAASFDFQCRPAAPGVLAAQCRWLQSSPESRFVKNAVCQKFVGGKLFALRDCCLRRVGVGQVVETVIDSVAEYRRVLASIFGIEVPNIASLWEKVNTRHVQWQSARSANVTSGA